MKIWLPGVRAGANRYLIRFWDFQPEPLWPNSSAFGWQIIGSVCHSGELKKNWLWGGQRNYDRYSRVKTYKDLARDILTFRKLDLDMIGVGRSFRILKRLVGQTLSVANQPMNKCRTLKKMTYKVIALTTFLVCPWSKVFPSTTGGWQALIKPNGPRTRPDAPPPCLKYAVSPCKPDAPDIPGPDMKSLPQNDFASTRHPRLRCLPFLRILNSAAPLEPGMGVPQG